MATVSLNRETESVAENEAITIAGLVIHEARAIHKPGQVFVYYGFRIRIISRHRNQITQLENKNQTKRSLMKPSLRVVFILKRGSGSPVKRMNEPANSSARQSLISLCLSIRVNRQILLR